MCDPLTIAGIAASVIGTGLQMKSQADARDEQRRIIRQNDERQSQLSEKNAAALAQAREGYKREGEGGFDEQMQGDIAGLAQKYQSVQSTGAIPGEFNYGSSGTPDVVKDYEVKQRGKAKDFSNAYAEALARMSGFGETMFDKGIGTQRAGEVFDMNRSFMHGNNAMTERQLSAAAANAGSPLGDLLATGGQLGMAYGLKAPSGLPAGAKVIHDMPWLNTNPTGAMSVMGKFGPMSVPAGGMPTALLRG